MAQAAGSNEWEALRSRLAWWLGRGDAERERGELERLDRSAAELAAAAMADRAKARQEAAWQTRIETVLESLDDDDQRAQAAAQLQQLLAAAAPSASGAGWVVSGNTFDGPSAIQAGNHNWQDVHFGSIRHTSPGPENEPDDDWPQET
ncbi:hypothetical protein [Streptomyces sp. NPDC046197]|uniref:hypothetical protein n=1 Tax=Streptomyces sp. NPDC046197 TaxID=3154337 RepID=UPI0033EF4860